MSWLSTHAEQSAIGSSHREPRIRPAAAAAAAVRTRLLAGGVQLQEGCHHH